MDNEDKKLLEVLNSYTVADADQALLDRIVAQAQEAKIVPLNAKRPTWIKGAAALAATAVLGFWLGSASLLTPANYASVEQNSSNSVNLDKVILGPKTFNEVML